MTAKFTVDDDSANPPINLTARSSAPSSPAAGDIYLDDGTNTASNAPGLRYYTGSAWRDLGALPSNDIYISADQFKPATTSGCAAVAQTEYATNDVDLRTLDFDQTTIEYAQCAFRMPNDWDGGTVTFSVAWTAAAGSAAQTVEWNLQGRAYADDDAIDQAWGSAVEVSDALIATGDVHVTAESAAVTLAGTPAAGQWVVLRVWRDASNDNLAADARFIGLTLTYTYA